jgi:hypothetical protein
VTIPRAEKKYSRLFNVKQSGKYFARIVHRSFPSATLKLARLGHHDGPAPKRGHHTRKAEPKQSEQRKGDPEAPSPRRS